MVSEVSTAPALVRNSYRALMLFQPIFDDLIQRQPFSLCHRARPSLHCDETDISKWHPFPSYWCREDINRAGFYNRIENSIQLLLYPEIDTATAIRNTFHELVHWYCPVPGHHSWYQHRYWEAAQRIFGYRGPADVLDDDEDGTGAFRVRENLLIQHLRGEPIHG